MVISDWIINYDDPLLVTGASGFIGSRVVEILLRYGFTNIRCLVRHSSDLTNLYNCIKFTEKSNVDIFKGNLLSLEDCDQATENISVIFHLAAGFEKTFPGCFMNSVITTRNLLESVIKHNNIKRFSNVSSFSVYSNEKLKRFSLLDETCEVENDPAHWYDPYVYAKIKQDEILIDFHKKYGIPYVITRPGTVFGPGKTAIPSRVGINTFGFFMNLGSYNFIPLTYVENCAEAIVLSGLVKGIDGNVFNIVDDNLPKGNNFLNLYKKNVSQFHSFFTPYYLFYFFCFLWEKYSDWSKGQLPPAFNRRRCSTYWRGNCYSNDKAKEMLGWSPKVSMQKALESFFDYAKGVNGIS